MASEFILYIIMIYSIMYSIFKPIVIILDSIITSSSPLSRDICGLQRWQMYPSSKSYSVLWRIVSLQKTKSRNDYEIWYCIILVSFSRNFIMKMLSLCCILRYVIYLLFLVRVYLIIDVPPNMHFQIEHWKLTFMKWSS